MRGFTLIELMITVAIVGVLGSIAVPNYQHMTMRARRAERDTMVDAVSRAVQGKLVHDGRFPASPFKGDWNPVGEPTTFKRRFNLQAVNWKDIDLEIEGDVYYRYYFLGEEAVDAPMSLTVLAEGDLDGDGVKSLRTVVYEVRDGSLLVKTDDYETDGIF
jgi:prepilin-type N-terminal cleavage/methylation domain-containing protein